MLLAFARASAAVVLIGLATHASGATTSFSVGVDADANPATGCSAMTPAGPLSGFELSLVVPVSTTATAGTVGALSVQTCLGGFFFGNPSPVDAGGWPIGVALGTGGSDVIEAYLPLSLLGSSQSARLAVFSPTADFIGPATVALGGGPSVNIPTLSPLAMGLLALGLALLALRYLRPGSGLGVVLLVLLAGGGLAWAAIAAHDGNPADWTGVPPLGTDPSGDAPAGADLVALFARADGPNLEIRIDARLAFDAANQAPVVNAGADQSVALPATATLNGGATDDGLPTPGALTFAWTQVSGPAAASFGTANTATTTASFPAPGLYTLRLTASDGSLSAGDDVRVTASGLVTVLDSAAAVQAVVGPDGASIQAVSGGKTYTLNIPIAALPANTTITVTPVTTIPNMPVFSGGLVAAVDLSPDGLQLARPATLTVTLPSAVSPAGLLGFLIDDAGTNLEVIDVAVNGTTLTMAVPHFTTGGVTQAQLNDFANDVRPILDSLVIPVSTTAALNLITRVGSWIERFGFAVCTGTDLCSRAFGIARDSLTQNQAQACAQAQAFIQQGEPFFARTALFSIVRIAVELDGVSSDAADAGVPGFDISFDLSCVADRLEGIATLAREQAIANPRAGLLVLLFDVAGDAASLILDSVFEHARAELLTALNAILDEANQDCLTDPASGEFLIDLVLATFPDSFLDALSTDLDTRFRDARAGCRVRISPPSANVALDQQLQFTGTVVGVSPSTVTWSIQSPALGSTIGPTSGLFTAGSFEGTVVVVATSVANPNLFKRAPVVVAEGCLAPATSSSSGARAPKGTCVPRDVGRFSASASVNNDLTCSDSQVQRTGTSASISVPLNCTRNGVLWQLLASNSSTLVSGAFSASLSRSGTPTAFGILGVANVRNDVQGETVLINAPGLTGTQGTFTVSMEIIALLSAPGPCSNDISNTFYAFGGLVGVGSTAQRFIETFRSVGNCSTSGPPLPAIITGLPVTFTYGAPFSFQYTFEAGVNSRREVFLPTEASASAGMSVTYRWLGMAGLPANATVTSASGIDWSGAAPSQ